MDHGKYMKRCYELAIRAGKKGFDTFGALLVHNGEILEEAENTADWNEGIFGHAEFNLVHKCANRYSDHILKKSVLYTSCAPCERCLCAIASLGVENVVFGVSYEEFSKLTPDDAIPVDREGLLEKLGIPMKLTGPVLEEEGMHVFEWWGGEYRPLKELIAEMAEVRKNRKENNMEQIWKELFQAAKAVQNPRDISERIYAGGVAAAIESASGKIYTGVCVDTSSSLGICAERNAMFNMITNGENEIRRVLAIMPDGKTGAPCGACREFMTQLMMGKYHDVEIMLDYEHEKIVTLGELTPEWWI